MNVLPPAALAAAGGAPLLEGAPAGKDVMVGVRPEAMCLLDGGGISANVVATEYLGADTLVQARVGESELMARLPGRIDLAPGVAIRLGWAADSRHWFDSGTGLRVA
jgi:sn-glycerol 3-phosphate transport system ATP-binding protein